jgi:hypothetical protein
MLFICWALISASNVSEAEEMDALFLTVSKLTVERVVNTANTAIATVSSMKVKPF